MQNIPATACFKKSRVVLPARGLFLFLLFFPLPSMADYDAVVVSNIAFGTIDVRGDASDVATASISAYDGSFTSDPGTGGGSAAINSNGGTVTRAVVEATTLPVSTLVTVSYNTKVNLSDGVSAFDTALVDNCDSPDVGSGGTAGSMSAAGVPSAGSATSTAAGELTFGIGASIATQAGDNYDPGTYNIGSFNVTLTYP